MFALKFANMGAGGASGGAGGVLSGSYPNPGFAVNMATQDELDAVTANGTLTGGGVVATGGFTLTIPATGTAALRGAANAFTAAQSIAGGSLLTSVLAMSQTWNNAGTVCRGLEFSVTDTNSASGSSLFRLTGGAAGTAELFKVDKSGNITISNGAQSAVMRKNSSYTVEVSDNLQVAKDNGYLLLNSNNGATIYGGLCGVASQRLIAANPFAFTTAMNFGVPNTYTSPTSFEELRMGWSANVGQIGTFKGSGGGTARTLSLVTDGTSRIEIDSAGALDFKSLTATADAALASTHSCTVKINGVSYKIPLVTA